MTSHLLRLRTKAQGDALVPPGHRFMLPVDDAYRDTPAATQSRLVHLIREGVPWREAVRAEYEQTHPWLYRIVTDPARTLFFDQYPPPPDSLILDVGAGWGQLTLPLARNHRIAALEPTSERMDFIAAAADQEGLSNRIHFIQASLLDVEFEPVFDQAWCIGVLEWVPKFTPGDPRTLQLEFLRRMRACLRPGGQCIIGIENRLGLKYLLGSADDHIGLPGIAVLDQARARARYQAIAGQELRSFTYSLSEYRDLLQSAGFSTLEIFAAYPDYKVPQRILPLDDSFNDRMAEAPFIAEHDGATGLGLPETMQEALASHYRSLTREGVAHVFAPSYFIQAL